AYNTLLNYLNLYSREHHPVITLTLRYPHSFPSFPQLFVIPAKAGIRTCRHGNLSGTTVS
ncbi:hypothetical protein ACFEC6_002257, partial [Neisseria gonorrhoeae]